MNQSNNDHLPPYRVRPRFKIETNYSPSGLEELIRTGLKTDNAPCVGSVGHHYAKLALPKSERHYWSPQLSLSMEETETGCILRGLYGPRENVWAMFIFFYAIIAFAILIIGIIGLSNLQLKQPATILWLVPVLMVLFLTLYLVAFFGQKLGHDQMLILHRYLEKTIGLEIL